MRGRKPTPSRLHELRGDPGKRHRNRDGEPRPDALEKAPAPPRHLNRRAAAVWRRVAPALVSMRLIAGIDSASLAGYCSAVATYEEADERLKTEPWTTHTARGGSRPNPLFRIRDEALKQVNKFAGEFGLTPSTRSRVKGASQPGQDAFEFYLEEAEREVLAVEEQAQTAGGDSRPPSEDRWN